MRTANDVSVINHIAFEHYLDEMMVCTSLTRLLVGLEKAIAVRKILKVAQNTLGGYNLIGMGLRSINHGFISETLRMTRVLGRFNNRIHLTWNSLELERAV